MSKTNKPWKKGDKVVRLYGSNSWSSKNAMYPGDIGTLSEDQEYPGTVKLVEFPDGVGHDPIRLRRLKDYKGFTAEELFDLYSFVKCEDFEAVVEFINKRKN